MQPIVGLLLHPARIIFGSVGLLDFISFFSTLTPAPSFSNMSSSAWSHGRVYVRNLPIEWIETDVANWVKECHLPPCSDIVLFKKKGADLCSGYLNWRKVTDGQVSTFCEQLCKHWVTFKQVVAEPAIDKYDSQRGPYTPCATASATAAWLKWRLIM